jgi:hypothetical protein
LPTKVSSRPAMSSTLVMPSSLLAVSPMNLMASEYRQPGSRWSLPSPGVL